jgi:hypothetical protein
MAKNVTPNLYREHNHHGYLHKTLRAWAGAYRDGARGKECQCRSNFPHLCRSKIPQAVVCLDQPAG